MHQGFILDTMFDRAPLLMWFSLQESTLNCCYRFAKLKQDSHKTHYFLYCLLRWKLRGIYAAKMEFVKMITTDFYCSHIKLHSWGKFDLFKCASLSIDNDRNDIAKYVLKRNCFNINRDYRWILHGVSLLMNNPRWRHNERDGVSNYQRLDCLLDRLFRRRLRKTSKVRVTSPLRGESSGHRWIPLAKG